jgi:hypothetical protein
MDMPEFDKNLRLKDLLTDFCGNPTPFKTLATLNENTSIVQTLEIFDKSEAKRKVVEVSTEDGQLLHLGYHELLALLKNRENPKGE